MKNTLKYFSKILIQKICSVKQSTLMKIFLDLKIDTKNIEKLLIKYDDVFQKLRNKKKIANV